MSTCLVTCGPALTRIDQVRHITNFSTGELGTLLCESLHDAGHEVICFRGSGATFRPPSQETVSKFSTNTELLGLLTEAGCHQVDYVFHAAALTDFEVASVTDSHGLLFVNGKIPSGSEEVIVHLSPSQKIIACLRPLFPEAQIVGWKYEVDGTSAEAEQKALLQLKTNRTNGCVLNGPVLGTRFSYVDPKTIQPLDNKLELVRFLTHSAAAQKN